MFVVNIVSSRSNKGLHYFQVDGVDEDGDGDGVQKLHAAHEEQAYGDAKEGYGNHDPDANNSDEGSGDASDEYLGVDDYVEESNRHIAKRARLNQ